MDWNKKSVERVGILFSERWSAMRGERRTDRRNFSAIWNKYLEGYGVTLLVPPKDSKPYGHPTLLLRRLMDLINLQNERVSDALIVPNPDRHGQYLLVPREVAQKILVLGMI